MDAKLPSLSPCDTDKLKRCLEEHDGDASRCTHLVDAFKASCGKQREEGAERTTTTTAEQAVAANPPQTATPTTRK